MVTAGFANDVDDVKKYADPIQAGTRIAPRRPLPVRVSAPMMSSRPPVATISPSQMGPPSRTRVDACHAGRSNMAFASATPATAPAIWATM